MAANAYDWSNDYTLEGEVEQNDNFRLTERDEVDTTFLDEVARRRAADSGSGEGSEREIYGSDIKKIKEQRIKELSALLNPTKK